jgi:arylsulfatase A-like enzyme
MDPSRQDPRSFKGRNFVEGGPRSPNPYYEYLHERGLEIPVPLQSDYTWNEDRIPSFRAYQNLISGPVEGSIPYFVGDEAVRLVESLSRRRKQDQAPFFLWANFWGPHNPCSIPEPYWSMYDPGSIPEPGAAGDPFENKPIVHERMARYWGTYGAPWSFWQKHLAAYYGYCTLIDDQVGRIRGALAEVGELENTVIIYASDHGDMLGRHQMLDKGPCGYEDIYHVPLVIRGGGSRGFSSELVYIQDLFPTILQMAGAEVPGGDFESLLPLIGPPAVGIPERGGLLGALRGRPGWSGDGGNWKSRTEVYGEFDRQITATIQRLIRTDRYKLVLSVADLCELYDLEDDPSELQNRYGDPDLEETQEELMDRLLSHLVDTEDPGSNPDYLQTVLR